MKISTPAVFNYIIAAGGQNLRVKQISIGAWNMQGVASISIAHGLTFLNIRHMSAVIIPDAQTSIIQFLSVGSGETSVHAIDADATNVRLQRGNNGIFSNAAFSSVAVNRGYVIIWYEG